MDTKLSGTMCTMCIEYFRNYACMYRNFKEIYETKLDLGLRFQAARSRQKRDNSKQGHRPANRGAMSMWLTMGPARTRPCVPTDNTRKATASVELQPAYEVATRKAAGSTRPATRAFKLNLTT